MNPHTITGKGLQHKSQSDNRLFGVGVNPDYVVFPSSKTLFAIGLIFAILAPLVGIILGLFFLRRPQLINEGRTVLLVAIAWLVVISIIGGFWSSI